MDDRTRYEAVKSRLRAMGQGTAQQVHRVSLKDYWFRAGEPRP
jgi:hypothetical protein